jgi:hypothetical protein
MPSILRTACKRARKVINGTSWILYIGAPWKDLPSRYLYIPNTPQMLTAMDQIRCFRCIAKKRVEDLYEEKVCRGKIGQREAGTLTAHMEELKGSHIPRFDPIPDPVHHHTCRHLPLSSPLFRHQFSNHECPLGRESGASVCRHDSQSDWTIDSNISTTVSTSV